MKLLMLIGAVFGFGLGMIISLAHECSWSSSLWHAAVAAYASGWIMLWWGRTLRSCQFAALIEEEAQAHSAPAIPIAKGTK
jgi:hypothetical protein